MNTAESIVSPSHDINTSLDTFVERYKAAASALNSARRGLYAAVGHVIELAEQIKQDPTALDTLKRRVGELNDVKNSPNYNAEDLTVIQLLLILAMGYSGGVIATKRGQYNAAIENFMRTANPRKVGAFVDWVIIMGGLRKAGQSELDAESTVSAPQDAPQAASAPAKGNPRAAGSAGPKGRSTSTAPERDGSEVARRHSFHFSNNAMILRQRTRHPLMVQARLPRGSYIRETAGLGLLVKHWDRDGNEQVLVMPLPSDSETVVTATRRLAREVSSAFLEELLLFRINSFTIGQAQGFRPSYSDVLRFDRTVKKLKNIPRLSEKYSLDRAYVKEMVLINDGHTKENGITPVNQDCHAYDPASLIAGAKAGVLVPYSLEGTDEQVRAAARRYEDEFGQWAEKWKKRATTTTDYQRNVMLRSKPRSPRPAAESGETGRTRTTSQGAPHPSDSPSPVAVDKVEQPEPALAG